MEDKERKNEEKNPMDNVMGMAAADLAKSVNAHIGITAYGKACFFRKEVLQYMSERMPEGYTLQVDHLIYLCREQGHEIADQRFSLSLVSLETTEEQWIESVNKPQEYDGEEDCEEEYDEEEDD